MRHYTFLHEVPTSPLSNQWTHGERHHRLQHLQHHHPFFLLFPSHSLHLCALVFCHCRIASAVFFFSSVLSLAFWLLRALENLRLALDTKHNDDGGGRQRGELVGPPSLPVPHTTTPSPRLLPYPLPFSPSHPYLLFLPLLHGGDLALFEDKAVLDLRGRA